jgi:hypothetical protein
MTDNMDGKFYTKGRSVWKRPLRTPDGKSATISCGFKVCQLDDYCPDEAAKMIADALNEVAERHAGCLCPHCNPPTAPFPKPKTEAERVENLRSAIFDEAD